MSDLGDDTADPEEDHGAAPRHRHAAPRTTVSRRRFLGWTAAGGAVAAAVALAITEEDPPGAHRTSAPRVTTGTTSTTAPAPTPSTTPADSFEDLALPLPVSPAIAAENAKPGDAWWVTTVQAAGDMEGFADVVSARVGDPVTLRVSTKAPTFHVEAYRMGYYQGVGGRLVWQSEEVAGSRQAPPVVLAPTSTVECQWEPSLQLTVGSSWPPGAYLLKLVGATGEQGFVPLCVRDDSSQSALLFQHGVTTWQAYNLWGGFSLYYGNPTGAVTFTQDPGGGTYAARARTVSFDRPYNHDWASGAADFVGNELPVIFHAEQLGLDVSYWTDVDLHEQPGLLANHRALLSLGHDEYWSSPMRMGVEQAVRDGLNVAFLGANACYRQIRFEPSTVGVDRRVVCYKSAAEDPMTGVDNSVVTVNWELPPVSNPESSMTGGMYQDVGAAADMVVADPGSWLLAGTGLTQGARLPNALRGEFDRYVPGGGAPANVDVVMHSLVTNRGGNYSDMTWYTVEGGGGVLDTGNASWVGQVADAPLVPDNVLQAAEPGITGHLQRIMVNVYSVLGNAPASIIRPSTGNWRAVYGSAAAAGQFTPGPNTQ